MKLRLLGDTIRLRLTRSEVDRVGQGQSIVETTRVDAHSQFEFALAPGDIDGVTAQFDGRRLSVIASPALLETWAATDRVALAEIDPDARLQILVEKDFNCLVPRDGNDDVDTFEHPEQGTRSC